VSAEHFAVDRRERPWALPSRAYRRLSWSVRPARVRTSSHVASLRVVRSHWRRHSSRPSQTLLSEQVRSCQPRRQPRARPCESRRRRLRDSRRPSAETCLALARLLPGATAAWLLLSGTGSAATAPLFRNAGNEESFATLLHSLTPSSGPSVSAAPLSPRSTFASPGVSPDATAEAH